MISFRLASSALRDENDRKDPLASVLLQESFENIPPCLFIVAELDPIRDDSYSMKEIKFKLKRKYLDILDYQKKLESAGIKTKLVSLKGVLHVYFSYPGEIFHL